MRKITSLLALGLALAGCEEHTAGPRLRGQVRMTLLHTADLHSRLYPYDLQIGEVDASLGLGEVGGIANVGGAARISHIIGRERARAERVLHLDGGDCFQGAPVFNFYSGEAEIRALAAMGADAMIVANHEFDHGALNLGIQLQRWASFPVLVSNYKLEDPAVPGASPLGQTIQPFQTFDLKGLRVSVLGMGNLSSLTSIYDQPNRLGVLPLKTSEVAQFYIDLLRPVSDLIVVVSHLGLEFDEELIEETTGIDVVLGGHNHIVLQPPKRVRDCARQDGEGRHYIELTAADPSVDGQVDYRFCQPREVVLAHSGAFAKYVGRLDVVTSNEPVDLPPTYDPLDGFEVVTLEYRLFPVNAKVPDDPVVKSLLEPYERGLDLLANLDLLVGYAPDGSRRFSATGGDSPLGNMISTAMWLRLGIQTDFSLTNTTGIRADMVPGPLDIEQMYNIFPFDNSISKMQLSGKEVQELFDFVARRSAGRGCSSQAQIAGARVVLDCQAECNRDEDCSAQNAGECEEATHTCVCPAGANCPGMEELRTGVATHVYIGPIDPEIPCSSDEQCPGATLGSCDVNTSRCWQQIDRIASYELATSNYLAGGGSGFRVLQRNTTQFDTKIQQRDALIDYIRAGKPCGTNDAGELFPCARDADCQKALGDAFVCACPENAIDDGGVCSSDPDVACESSGGVPEPGEGACVYAPCRNDVAAIQREICSNAPSDQDRQECLETLDPCQGGGEQCKFLACIDQRLGNASDSRVRMVGK